MKIGIDAMGGDFAPKEVLDAVLNYTYPKGMELYLYGENDIILGCQEDLESRGIEFIQCGESISMGENATRGVASKKDSSINVGIQDLAKGTIDAFVGAGNTGAMMVSSLYNLGTIAGIDRPALTSVLPQVSGATGVLLDVGANADIKAETLAKFALLGSIYMQVISSIQNPKVGLLNIGEEEEKGTILTKSAYKLLQAMDGINFIGNIEGRHLFNDFVDVAVCDGFTGNVVVKTCESLFYNLLKRGVNDSFLNTFNFELYGGSPILGIKKPVIVGHGISKASTIKNMINSGANLVSSDLIAKIEVSLKNNSN